MTSLRKQLEKIQGSLKDGQFIGADGAPLQGQDSLKALLERCWRWTEIVLERCARLELQTNGNLADQPYREGQISEGFQEQYERLVEIRNQLDRLSVTQAWSLRETDLFEFQRKLDRIDEARVNGNFVSPDGQQADLHAQRVRSLHRV